MPHNPLRVILNEYQWTEDISAISLKYIMRTNGREELIEIKGSKINKIEAFGITTKAGTFIPYHRIQRIDRLNEQLYESSQIPKDIPLRQ